MIEDFIGLIPSSLHSCSGKVFYSGRLAFNSNSDLYLLGLNPGGSPEALALETLAGHSKMVLNRLPDNWSAYRDESWEGTPPGTYRMQPRVLHMLNCLGLDAGLVPASNLIFVRSEREAQLADSEKLAMSCWQFHKAVIERLGVKVVVCFGATAGSWVCRQLNVTSCVDSFVEQNQRRWTSRTFKNPSGVAVIVATHPSIADWTNANTDPTPLVRKVLA
jgi:hypothetical protein